MPSVVLSCFFLSGASGLILELLWTRMLTLVFGSTALAVSTVLTAYMGGLGLGSYLAGKISDRLKDPVRAYALAEAAIGIYALSVPWIIGYYPALNQWLWSTFGDRYTLLSVLRFFASALRGESVRRRGRLVPGRLHLPSYGRGAQHQLRGSGL